MTDIPKKWFTEVVCDVTGENDRTEESSEVMDLLHLASFSRSHATDHAEVFRDASRLYVSAFCHDSPDLTFR